MDNKVEHGQSIMDSLIAKNEINNFLNRINPSTVQETRRGISPFGTHTNALYKALTYGGENRDIHRDTPGIDESGEMQPIMLVNLLKEIAMNPDFSDTLTAETRPDIKAELDYSDSPLRYLKHLFTK